MQQAALSAGITFSVDDVKPATKLLAECRTHEALKDWLGGIESCHDYHGMTVKKVKYQPLLAAVYMAFSHHRPLILTPDAVWLTIAQGVAQHMAIHGERLRSRFVSHQGKLELVFKAKGWVDGSPENPWSEAFESWASQIREHVGPEMHDTLVCDFSTSGATERAASQIVMMDVFERYFHYVMLGICGIPNVTLEGTTKDWQRLADKVARLRLFDIDWWLDQLDPICGHFIRASQGDADVAHWQNICKLQSEYGGDIINGWVAKLFPYLRTFINGPCNRKNPIFETGEGFQTLVAPTGLSRVPFTWRNAETGRERAMEALGGLVGVTQGKDTLALRPTVGWAIREAEKMEALLARLAKDHRTFPGIKLDDLDNGPIAAYGLPPDMAKFYHQTNGAELFDHGGAGRCRIVAREQIDSLDSGEKPDDLGSYGPNGRIWHRFAWLPDGSWLAINLDINARDPRPKKADDWSYDPNFHAICHSSTATLNRPGNNPVVALSFSELLERLLDCDGPPYWLDPQFKSYGDAELFTRRK